MDRPTERWNDRLRSAREAKGFSVPDLARAIVGSEDDDALATMTERIYSYEKKAKPVSQPRGDMMQQLARALGVRLEWLRDGGTTTGNHQEDLTLVGLDESKVTPNLSSGKQTVKYPRQTLPIYGRAAGGREGKFILNGERVGEILRPPSLEAVAEAYCVEAVGDSMSPVIEEGYKLYVNPKRPYRRGHLVVVQIRTDVEGVNEGYAKRFVSFSSKELILEQENPPKGHDRTIRFPAGDVVSIHRIVGVEFD